MNNPLDDLQQFDSSSLPSAPRQHTSGRRELRRQLLSRGITIHARPKTEEDRLRALAGNENIETLPVKRTVPKRRGMTKKEWKRARREARQD